MLYQKMFTKVLKIHAIKKRLFGIKCCPLLLNSHVAERIFKNSHASKN